MEAGFQRGLASEVKQMNFNEYLVSAVGKKKAREILDMTQHEKSTRFIVITGRQGPTGKSTLSEVLERHGYRTLELYEHIFIELNEEIQRPDIVPNFASLVD